MAERGSRAYEATMRELPPATMTKQQERELSVRALAGDIEAANELAAGHMRFAAMIARRYARAHPTVPVGDLTSAAFMGLVQAAKTFDGARGNRFISYAAHWVHQRCRVELATMSQPVKLPPAVTQGVGVVRAFYALNENSHKRPHLADTDAILAFGEVKLGGNKGRRSFVESAIVAQHHHRSLDDQPRGDGGRDDSPTYKDRLLCHSAPASDDVEAKSDAALIERMISLLLPREQYIIRRYFLGGEEGDPVSLDVIAGELGLTRERIRQLKNHALEEMREAWAFELSMLAG